MESETAGRRHGPLTAVEGTAPALAIGDVDVHHVRLAPDGIALHLGATRRDFVAWDTVRDLTVEPPHSWWPHPAMGDTFWPALEGILGGGAAADTVPETPTYPVRITTGEFETLEWDVTTHYLSGYRRRDAHATTRLAEYLIAHPDARVLLAQPDALLDRITSLLRTVPPIGK